MDNLCIERPLYYWRLPLCGLELHERSDWRWALVILWHNIVCTYCKPIYTSLFGGQLRDNKTHVPYNRILHTKRRLYCLWCIILYEQSWLATLPVECLFNWSLMLILKLLRGTGILLYEFAAKQQIKEHELGVNTFLYKLSTSRDGRVKSTETRKGWKHKKATVLQKNCGKERLEDYSTSVVWVCNRCYHDFAVAKSCVFIPALFLYFLQAHPYLQLIFIEKILALTVHSHWEDCLFEFAVCDVWNFTPTCN